jgi:hypothetical protein
MTETTPSPLGTVITIDDERIKNHLDRVVRGSRSRRSIHRVFQSSKVICLVDNRAFVGTRSATSSV